MTATPFRLIETGDEAAAAVRAWGHIRMFSPWSWNIDSVARTLLEQSGWTSPDANGLPTGRDLRERYLLPLAGLLAPDIVYGREVVSIARADANARNGLELRLSDGSRVAARAVIDASGVWSGKNGLGPRGRRLEGEQACEPLIDYGPVDVLARAQVFSGRSVLVVGGGHSGMHAALDLADLADRSGSGKVVFASRAALPDPDAATNDKFPGRTALHRRIRDAVRTGRVALLAPFDPLALRRTAGGFELTGITDDGRRTVEAGRLIVTTGFHPDVALTGLVGAAFDPELECPAAFTSIVRGRTTCGEFPAFGLAELSHPVAGCFTVGIKSFGRAGSFDLQLGYRQADLVAEALAAPPPVTRTGDVA